MIVDDRDDFVTLLVFIPREPNAIPPFLATVLVPSPWSTLRSSCFSAARCPEPTALVTIDSRAALAAPVCASAIRARERTISLSVASTMRPSAPTLKDEWDHPIHAANLAQRWTFRGGSSREDIFRTMSTGFNGTPMPSFADALTPEQRWAITDFIVSL